MMNTRTIVIVIAAVAALFALGILSPKKIAEWKCRGRQLEAKSTLKEISKRIGDNLAKGKAASSFDDLAWWPKDPRHYDYSIRMMLDGHYVVEAQGIDVNGDKWSISDETGLRNALDGCGTGQQ
jgi:hypothetical protein